VPNQQVGNQQVGCSKYLDSLDWMEANNIYITKAHKNLIFSQRLLALKASMNDGRVKFNWDHLNNFYSY